MDVRDDSGVGIHGFGTVWIYESVGDVISGGRFSGFGRVLSSVPELERRRGRLIMQQKMKKEKTGNVLEHIFLENLLILVVSCTIMIDRIRNFRARPAERRMNL